MPARARDRVLLLNMPFGALGRPALGLSLLKPLLARRGVECDIGYLSFAFADFIGGDDYAWVSSALPHTAFAGDWCFTDALYGPRPGADEAYARQILAEQWGLDGHALLRLRRIRSLVEPFLDHCLESIDWSRYRLVGFTSTFEQNLASLALAARLKAAHPEIFLLFGGANWEGAMGEELHRRFPFVDAVCSGEGEESLPRVVEAVFGGTDEALDEIPGIVFRRAGETRATGATRLVRDLDALPVPDYEDYFAALQGSAVGHSVVPTLLIETSRGCWWGVRSHCTFCGLNGNAMTFRRKSPERVLAEIDELVGRWGVSFLEATDNILDMRFFEDLLPALAKRGGSPELFFEVKANLDRRQVELLAAAGVRRIQPGIESLSDGVLSRMRKGTRGVQNLQLLKWCREVGIDVEWNLLYGFPGETREEYRQCLDLLAGARGLEPPGACAPIRLDRFSPYFADPAAHGFTAVRPMAAYSHLYPFPEASLQRIAYYFEYDYSPEADPGPVAQEVVRYVDEWRQRPERGHLRLRTLDDQRILLTDTRQGAPCPQLELAGVERAAYEHCDSARTPSGLRRHLEDRFPDTPLPEDRLVSFLDSMVANRLMASDGRYYLSMALRTEAT